MFKNLTLFGTGLSDQTPKIIMKNRFFFDFQTLHIDIGKVTKFWGLGLIGGLRADLR